MSKPPSDQFETVVKRLLATPPKPHSDSKVGKPKLGAGNALKPQTNDEKQLVLVRIVRT